MYYCFLSLHVIIHEPPCSCSFNLLIGTIAVVSSLRNWMIAWVSRNKYYNNYLYINTIYANIYLSRRNEWSTEESRTNAVFALNDQMVTQMRLLYLVQTNVIIHNCKQFARHKLWIKEYAILLSTVVLNSRDWQGNV